MPLQSLDDVAVLLVQLEPTDLSDLARVREALNDIATRGSSPGLVQDLVAEAWQKIDDITQGRASDPRSVLADVGRLIDIATDAMEEGRPEEIPQPAPTEPPSPSPDRLPADANPDLLREFITESLEYIERAEAALLALETDPEDAEAVNTVFRAFHTIKGTSAFLGLDRVSELAHLAESLLSRVRDREIRCTGGYADLALRSVDMLKELIQTVQDALGGKPMTRPEGYEELLHLLANPEAAGISGEPSDTTKASPRFDFPPPLTGEGEGGGGAKAPQTPQRVAGGVERTTDSSVRVRTDRLDRLIDMVGELVIAHSMVAQDETVVYGGHHELLRKVTRAGKIVRELQDLSLAMRMVPLKATFQKIARLVRDLAQKSGKIVHLVTEGEDTEIDRNMVDVINDPLVHMVRNAIDHGIEPPEVREQSGKSRAGTVRLRAYHLGGNVVVEMQDDGRGLDRDKIIKKAISQGLIKSDKGVSDSEVFNLIFKPGFSTADKVTDVSGRGVGLDVVKKSVEALRGRIDIASEAGKGCAFTVRLPLTLAITDGMLVKVGAERYIMPTLNIHMSFRPDAGVLSTIAGRGEMVMLRGELMPVFRLHRLFDIEGAVEDPMGGLLVIVVDGDRRCALLVDELLGQQQVVAKSLSNGLGKIQGVSGGAILGDGRVGLILDTAEIAALARRVPSDGKGAVLRAAA